MTTHTERRDTRLVARTSTEIQEIIQLAAELSGASMSQFLIQSTVDRARDVIAKAQTFQLSMAGADALFDVLDNPPKANKKLLKAATHYKDTVNAPENRTPDAAT